MRKCILNGKWEIILPDHRANRPEWYTEQGWEKARLESMHDHLGKDDTIFYVGAEEGDMAALCQMWGAKVVMFEPNDRVWTNMKAIWEANKLEDPYWFSGFASNKTTADPTLRCGFYDVRGDMITDHGFKELCDPGIIPQVRIDDLQIRPTAISIDVEGSEWEVLKGAERTLREFHPKLWVSIHPEFAFRIYRTYQAELRKWIKDFGYKETILDYQHELHVFYD